MSLPPKAWEVLSRNQGLGAYFQCQFNGICILIFVAYLLAFMCVPMSSIYLFLLTLLYRLEFLLFASFRNRHSFAPTRTVLTSRWGLPWVATLGGCLTAGICKMG